MIAALSESYLDHLKIITLIHDLAAQTHEDIHYLYKDIHTLIPLKYLWQLLIHSLLIHHFPRVLP